MTEYQDVLLRLLSKALFDRTVDVPETDWAKLAREAEMQTVSQLAYSALDEKRLPSELAARWKERVLSGVANNVRVAYDHALLHEWMSEAGIPYAVLKGCASAAYYPDPLYRSMGDVDFLVPEDALEAAGRVMERQGLTPWEEEHISHIVYRRQGAYFEMHFRVAGLPNGAAGERIREYMADVFEKATVQPIENGRASLPAPFHHGLVLLLHTCHHLTGEGVGLRHLCDWGVFENRFSDAEFRALFEEKLKAVGLWRFAQVLTLACVKYLGAPKREWAEAAEGETVDGLMADILAGGNFGRKDGTRQTQTLLISDRGKNGVGKTGMTAQFTESINSFICQKWPAARKNKLLLPAGWLYFGGRRLIREVTAKKKTDVKRLVNTAAERRDLYRKLHIYEREDG
ncbi:MAG: nucleotidyltransferase family protein [Oscillibacter sp.]|nr:nucleotidyltransferase family protein [Oscillibacter sp.]